MEICINWATRSSRGPCIIPHSLLSIACLPGPGPAPSSVSFLPSVFTESGSSLRSLCGLCPPGFLLHLFHPAPRIPTVSPPLTFPTPTQPPAGLRSVLGLGPGHPDFAHTPPLTPLQLHPDTRDLCRHFPAAAGHCADLHRVLLWFCK